MVKICPNNTDKLVEVCHRSGLPDEAAKSGAVSAVSSDGFIVASLGSLGVSNQSRWSDWLVEFDYAVLDVRCAHKI